MKIVFNMEDFVGALDLVSIVPPTKTVGASGYLFVVKGEQCFVYSRDSACTARAQFALREADGEGTFAYPAEYIGALKVLSSMSDTCEIEAVEEDGKFTVKYRTSSGAKAERGSFDPHLLETCDYDLEESEVSSEFLPGVLREAIAQARPFISKQDGADEHLKGLQVLDASRPEYAKGDGMLFVGDGTRTFYFRTSAFLGKSLDIHGHHLAQLVSFLGRTTDPVTIRKGKHFTFVVDTRGDVFGWPKHTKGHQKYGYYSLDKDSCVLTVVKARILNSLQHIRSELDKDDSKIKISFDPEHRSLLFEAAAGDAKVEGVPIQVEVKQASPDPWSFYINIQHMLDTVSPVKGHEFDLRVCVIPASKDRRNDLGMFRVIENFYIDAAGKVVIEAEEAFECQVTRFMPSRA